MMGFPKIQVLIIEEVSMLSGEFLDGLSQVIKEIRQSRGLKGLGNDLHKPFGDIQVGAHVSICVFLVYVVNKGVVLMV